jgi:hypothetical protein
MKFIDGDLLDLPQADLIAQQCNCLTVKSQGLAASLAAKFPIANCYAKRRPVGKRNLAIAEDRDKPGTALITGKVINLFGQWRPGKINASCFDSYPECPSRAESVDARADWFKLALADMLRQLTKPKTVIGIPFRIGCGLAGGDWRRYLMMLREFEEKHASRVEFIIVTPPAAKPAEKRKRE